MLDDLRNGEMVKRVFIQMCGKTTRMIATRELAEFITLYQMLFDIIEVIQMNPNTFPVFPYAHKPDAPLILQFTLPHCPHT